MKCNAMVELDEPMRFESLNCENEAEYIACEPFIGIKVCREHKCRCNRTIARADAEKAPTPAHWMAL